MSHPTSIGRRRFLKYVVAGAVVAAAGYGYYEYSKKQPYNPPINTTTAPTLTPTVTPTPTTPTSTKLASLAGRLFHDYNGNGVQDADEPAIQNARVLLKDQYNEVVADAKTDSSGDYKIEDVKVGSYRAYVETDEKFRYMCTSPADLRPTKGISRDFPPFYENCYDVELGELEKMNIGLMEGPFTHPFYKGVDYHIQYYVDVDPAVKIRDWSGGARTYDRHFGTDYVAERDTPVCALAPGVVIQAVKGYPKPPKNAWYDIGMAGNNIFIDHENGFMSSYSHLSKINVNPIDITPDTSNPSLQRVKRGEIIGFVGNTGGGTGSIPPHLHLQIQKYISRAHYVKQGHAIDPYRDIKYNPESGWGVAKFYCSNPISLWTEDNKPHHPQKFRFG